MSLVHNEFTKVTLRKNNAILEEKSIFVIKAIALVLGLALGNPIFHLLHHGIKKLCLTNLIFQSRRDYEVGQKALRNNLKRFSLRKASQRSGWKGLRIKLLQ